MHRVTHTEVSCGRGDVETDILQKESASHGSLDNKMKFDQFYGAPDLLSKIQETNRLIADGCKPQISFSNRQLRTRSATFRPPSTLTRLNSSEHYAKKPKFTIIIRRTPELKTTPRKTSSRLAETGKVDPSPSLTRTVMNQATVYDQLRVVFLQWAVASRVRIEPLQYTSPDEILKGMSSPILSESLHAIVCLMCCTESVEGTMNSAVLQGLQSFLQKGNVQIQMASALCLMAFNRGDPCCIQYLRNVLLTEKQQESHVLEIQSTVYPSNQSRQFITDKDRQAATMSLVAFGIYEPLVVEELLGLMLSRVRQILPAKCQLHDVQPTIHLQPKFKPAHAVEVQEHLKTHDYPLMTMLQQAALQEVFYAKLLFVELEQYYEVALLMRLAEKHPSLQDTLSQHLDSQDWRDRISMCWLMPEFFKQLEHKTAQRMRRMGYLDWNLLVRLAALRCVKQSLLGQIITDRLDPPIDDPFLTRGSYTDARSYAMEQPLLYESLLPSMNTPSHRAERLFELISASDKIQFIQILVSNLEDPCNLVRKMACKLAVQSDGVNNALVADKLLKLLCSDHDNRVKLSAAAALTALKVPSTHTDNLMTSIRERIHDDLRNAVRDELNPNVRLAIIDLLLELIRSHFIEDKTHMDRLSDKVDRRLFPNQPTGSLKRRNIRKHRVKICMEDYQEDDRKAELISHLLSADDMADESTDSYSSRYMKQLAQNDDSQSETILPLSRTYEYLAFLKYQDPCQSIRGLLESKLDSTFDAILKDAKSNSAFDRNIVIKGDITYLKSVVQDLGRNAIKIYGSLMENDKKWREMVETC
ncbi:hypothetical protein P879_07041 [Paragonimus westermani]|uniref:Uncharacterized protein n=1 Tax=Paragonimus westermani TaxID=34504 RepID=A0A8T0DQZ6_9TREM|nr:hypothetical protein P879_07041 [Paragonimus westermani]